MKCTLLKEINKCQYCDLETMVCNNPKTECAFKDDNERNNIKESSEYVRQERWYEKYYRKK